MLSEYAQIPESLQTVIKKTIQAYLTAEEDFDLDIGELHLRVYIKGPAWAGIVDRTLAKFVVDLDRAVGDILKKHGIDIPDSPHGLIALKVKEGSMEAFLKYAKGIFPLINKMKTRDKLMIIVAIMAAVGNINPADIIEQWQKTDLAKVELEKAKLELEKDLQISRNHGDIEARLVEATAKGNLAIVEAMTRASDSARQLQQPIRSLVNNLHDEDKITLPGAEKPMDKKEAKETLVKGERHKPTNCHIDRRYIVEGLYTKKPGEWEITLTYGDHTFKAKLALADDQITELLESFQHAHASGQDIAPDLQITAVINVKGVQSATVTGLGEPREGSRSLGDILLELKNAAIKEENEILIEEASEG